MREMSSSGCARRVKLREWFKTNRREFPWRSGTQPWETFVAEMLLRRTRAEQVASLLPTVLAAYPCPTAMAEAQIEEIEAVLRPVGLRGRAAELQQCALIIERDFGGSVPAAIDDLLMLPGVGPYVASSVAAVLSSEHVILIDTNTVRVARRVGGIEVRARDVRRQKIIVEAIEGLLDGPAPARDWWAVIDLAARVCRPREPHCEDCPIIQWCAEGSDRSERRTSDETA